MAVTLCLLGSTGSIGQQTLDIVRQHPDEFNVVALTAYQNHKRLFEQCLEFKPSVVVCVNAVSASSLRADLAVAGLNIDVLSGVDALVAIAKDTISTCVVAGIVGSAGLPATFAAVEAGKRVLLANKEALVMSGHLFLEAIHANQAIVLPLDSEHNAIFQCLADDYVPGMPTPANLSHVTLTASGGPFWSRTASFDTITPAEAVAHPNWSMGSKISVDSATMMNKGLEVIEACWLFGLCIDRVKVVIHPQSIIHSFAHFKDGSTLAQCGYPDMRVPISYCLGWPERLAIQSPAIDMSEIGQLDFFKPDHDRFPCLSLAYQAFKSGPAACVVLNIVNELAVADFLAGNLSFLDISSEVEKALNQYDLIALNSIDDILSLEQEIRMNWRKC